MYLFGGRESSGSDRGFIRRVNQHKIKEREGEGALHLVLANRWTRCLWLLREGEGYLRCWTVGGLRGSDFDRSYLWKIAMDRARLAWRDRGQQGADFGEWDPLRRGSANRRWSRQFWRINGGKSEMGTYRG
jgi:hypothetical protein